MALCGRCRQTQNASTVIGSIAFSAATKSGDYFVSLQSLGSRLPSHRSNRSQLNSYPTNPTGQPTSNPTNPTSQPSAGPDITGPTRHRHVDDHSSSSDSQLGYIALMLIFFVCIIPNGLLKVYGGARVGIGDGGGGGGGGGGGSGGSGGGNYECTNYGGSGSGGGGSSCGMGATDAYGNQQGWVEKNGDWTKKIIGTNISENIEISG